ncbi:hypothetical protein CP8484711_2021, partial [Chlamydia psittaci 84-8471/1]
MTFPFI